MLTTVMSSPVKDFDEFLEEFENEQNKERQIKKSINSKRLSKSTRYSSARVSEAPETTQSITNITIHEDNQRTPDYRLPDIGDINLSQETLDLVESFTDDLKPVSLLVECFKQSMEKYEEAMFDHKVEEETLKMNDEIFTLSKIFSILIPQWTAMPIFLQLNMTFWWVKKRRKKKEKLS